MEVQELPDLAIDAFDLYFDDLLAQAIDAPDDQAAQDALQNLVQEVIASGNMERVMNMSAIIGATACMHSHLEGTASLFGQDAAPKHAHEHDSGDTKQKTFKRGKSSTVQSTKQHASILRIQYLGLRELIAKYFGPAKTLVNGK